MAEKEGVKRVQAQRFELIEWHAYWLGRVNRSVLETRFGISTPQASLDFRSYQEIAPNNIEYDSTEKTYVPTESFLPKFLNLSANRYLMQLHAIMNSAILQSDTWFGSLPPAAVMPTIERSVEPEVLRAVLKAIEKRLELNITYCSLTNTRSRVIVPHALAFDGHRWHTRAWCVEKSEFRDFVLTRTFSVSTGIPSKVDPTDDMEWNTIIDLKIIPHPELDAAQKLAIERDYGMDQGARTFKTRVALTFYFIRNYNLDLTDGQIPPKRMQIFLANRVEVEEAQRLAKAETIVRIVSKKSG